MKHDHLCPVCDRQYECTDTDCQQQTTAECMDCIRDGERELCADISDYANWV